MVAPPGLESVAPPAYFTRFIGRAEERGLLRKLVAGDADLQSRRLLTLVGRGGAGKTRLAAEFARVLAAETSSSSPSPSGVAWAELDLLSDVSQLPHVVAAAVGLPHASGADLLRALARYLAPRRQLVVLDGCERMTAACREFADTLLAECPLLFVLATSRVRLRSPHERVVRVRPLDAWAGAGAPAGTDATIPHEARQLFLDRATVGGAMSLRDLDAMEVDAVCRRVGGLPLAIELVAAWVGERSAADLLAALECGRTVAGREADRRVRVPVVLDIIWAWLDGHERRVLQCLGSFAGDFTREAAREVAGADLAALDALTRRSLIARIADLDDATRYRVHPLVRRHAVRMLDRDPDESGPVRRRHLDYCVSVAESAPGGKGDRRELLRPGVQAEYEAALHWGRTIGATEPVLRLLAALHRNEARWNTSALFLGILEAALARPQDPSQPTSQARSVSLEAAGWAAAECGDHGLAGRRFAEAAAAYRGLDARSSQAASLRGQATAHLSRNEVGAATFRLRESLAICRRIADLAGMAWSALHLAEVTAARGEPMATTGQLVSAIRDFEALGIPLGAYRGSVRLGAAQRSVGRLPEAIDAYAQALALGRRWHFVIDMEDVLAGLGIVAAELHRPVCAATLLGARRAWVDSFGRSSVASVNEDPVSAERRVRAQISNDEHFVAAVAAGLQLDAAHIRAEAELTASELAGLCRRLLWGITEREVEVLRLVAEGLTDADIAGCLELSPRTVHAHLRSAYGKLGVGARTAAVRQAVSQGLI